MNNKLLLRVPVKYGAFASLLAITVLLGLYFMDESPFTSNDIPDFIIIGLFVYFAIREFRDYYNGGNLQFWEGMTVGFFCYVTLAVLTALFIGLLFPLIDADILQQYVQNRTNLLVNNKEQVISQLNEEAYNKALKEIKETSLLDLSLDDLIRKLLMGLFLTSVLALASKRKIVSEKSKS